MSNNLLKPVFKRIFGVDFNQSSFKERLKMQKMVYLLQSMGISIGNYNFLWYKHGPYSQTLQNDILSLQGGEEVNIKFSNDAEKEIRALRDAMAKECVEYNQCRWAECLGSLLYIKENVLSSLASDEEILEELIDRKPHLKNKSDNELALKTLKELSI